jgi:hypothetical protein
MGGFSSVTGDETIMFADNASFDGTQRGGKITTDGQLWIGSTASPHVKKGLPTGVSAFSAPVMQANYGSGTLSFENRTWSTPYVVDSNATVGQRGTFTTIQAAVNACFSDGNASTSIVGYIKIRGKGGASPYVENITFPGSSLFYLEGDLPNSPNFQGFDTVIQGIHIMSASSGIYAKNITFDSNSGSLTAFNFSNTTSVAAFYDCYVSFSNTGATVYLESCILPIGGTQSGGSLTAFNTQLVNGMNISAGTQVFTQCKDTTFVLSGSAAPVCVDCTISSNGGSWSGSTSGTPTILGCEMASQYGYTGNIRVGNLSEHSGATVGDFFGSGINQSLARTIQGNVRIMRSISADTTITNHDYYVGVTSTATAINITLPNTSQAINKPYKGQVFFFQDQSGSASLNHITITPNGGLINQLASCLINQNFGFVELTFDGTNYFVTDSGTLQNQDGFFIKDDFIYDGENNTRVWPWGCGGNGTAATVVATTPVSGHPGIISLNAGTDINGESSMNRGQGAGNVILGDGSHELNFVVRVPTLSTVTDEFDFWFGLGDGLENFTSHPGNNCVAFQYSRLTSTNWQGITKSGGSSTTASGGSNVAVTTGWANFKIIINAAGTSATFYVNGVNIGTSTTNIPTTNPIYLGFSIKKSLGITSSNSLVDYVDWNHVLTTPRF